MRSARGKGIRARGTRIGGARQSLAAARTGALGVLLLVFPFSPAWAGAPRGEGAGKPAWLSLGVVTGWVKPDSKLADYQWDTSPGLTFGGEAFGGLGRVAVGARVLRSQTTQSLGSLATPGAATVRATSWELVGRVRLASLGRTDFLAAAGGGRLHLGYAPDRIQVDAGTGSAIAVELKPVDEWMGVVGVVVERPLANRWIAAVTADHRFFSMETAHRSGSEIVRADESFGGWGVRLGLAWRYGI